MTKEKVTFEEAFSRLEAILEAMNKDKIALDESLKLFEEANRLINFCSERLVEAESKIETLIKERTGELILDKDGKPKMANFNPPKESVAQITDELPF